jgi:hypothetical protein
VINVVLILIVQYFKNDQGESLEAADSPLL